MTLFSSLKHILRNNHRFIECLKLTLSKCKCFFFKHVRYMVPFIGTKLGKVLGGVGFAVSCGLGKATVKMSIGRVAVNCRL